jgi:hypothetical protein
MPLGSIMNMARTLCVPRDLKQAARTIAAGQVLVLSGAVAGSYPIVSIDSTTQMTISALYDGLLPYVSSSQVAPVGAGSLTYTVRTFSPQSGIVSAMLLQAAGILPGTASAGGEVLNPESLRRPCVLGTLQMIYSALSAAAEAGDVARLSVRADLYERLYRRAMRSCHVEIDTDGDGEANLRRPLNVMMLVRA